jgi:hypothetical protein
MRYNLVTKDAQIVEKKGEHAVHRVSFFRSVTLSVTIVSVVYNLQTTEFCDAIITI